MTERAELEQAIAESQRLILGLRDRKARMAFSRI
jgi:hypothetical protein